MGGGGGGGIPGDLQPWRAHPLPGLQDSRDPADTSSMRIAVLLPLLLAGCVTTVENAPPHLSSAVIRRGKPTAAWAAVENRVIRGYVVRFEPPCEPERFLYSVRNEHQQDLGVIDSIGRAYRYRPHADEPDWVGSGTVLFGVRRMLGGGPEMQLLSVELVDEDAQPSDREEASASEGAPGTAPG